MRRQARRGQAMLEYSAITGLLFIGGSTVGLVVFLPAMMNALNVYLSGIYYMLNLAIP